MTGVPNSTHNPTTSIVSITGNIGLMQVCRTCTIPGLHLKTRRSLSLHTYHHFVVASFQVLLLCPHLVSDRVVILGPPVKVGFLLVVWVRLGEEEEEEERGWIEVVRGGRVG